MRFADYWKDKIPGLLLHAAGLLMLSCYLRMTGNSPENVILIDTAWIFVVAILYSVDYFRRQRYFKEIDMLLHELDKPYLISEVMEKPYGLEDKLNREILRKSN